MCPLGFLQQVVSFCLLNIMLKPESFVFNLLLSNTDMIKNIGYGLKNMRNSTFKAIFTHAILPLALPQH